MPSQLSSFLPLEHSKERGAIRLHTFVLSSALRSLVTWICSRESELATLPTSVLISALAALVPTLLSSFLSLEHSKELELISLRAYMLSDALRLLAP